MFGPSRFASASSAEGGKHVTRVLDPAARRVKMERDGTHLCTTLRLHNECKLELQVQLEASEIQQKKVDRAEVDFIGQDAKEGHVVRLRLRNQ